jgi:hypothetical protein
MCASHKEMRIGSKFARVRLSVIFLSVTGRLLRIPTAAAFSSREVGEEMIFTKISRWVSLNCSANSCEESFDRWNVKFSAAILISTFFSVRNGRSSCAPPFILILLLALLAFLCPEILIRALRR